MHGAFNLTVLILFYATVTTVKIGFTASFVLLIQAHFRINLFGMIWQCFMPQVLSVKIHIS